MRVVGGRLGGRRFFGPPNDGTRPTSDRAREAIASAIDGRRGFDGALVLDLYAGTGAFSFESVSRGAAQAIAVDNDRACLRAIEQSIEALGLSGSVRTLPIDLGARGAVERVRAAAGGPVDLVFADPPWKMADDAARILGELSDALAPQGRVVLVHAARAAPPPPAGLSLEAQYRYGDTAVAIYRRPDEAAPGPRISAPGSGSGG